jgi:peptidoglycan hydrolase-like protein with peptidoglycan-binding domain
MQERLQELGFYDGPIDGIYGAQTANAVREY